MRNKLLLLIPFVLIAVLAVYAGLRNRGPAPAASDTTAAPSSLASPSSAASDAPLTKKEREEISIHLTPSQCEEIQRHVQSLPDPPPRDAKGLRLMAACMRHGSVAWFRCATASQTRADMQVCNHRLLNVPESP